MQPIYILQPLSSAAAAIAEIEVPATGRLKVGRETTNDVALPHDLRMSSAHFELTAEPGGCRVRDLGSTNGLFLNTKRIANALLVEGDEVQAGESRWRVALHNAAVAPYTADPPVNYLPAAGPANATSNARRSTAEVNNELPCDLQLTTDRDVTRRFSPAQVVTIGRTALADWVFDHDVQMSSLHAEVFQYAGSWRVKDLDSSNGIFLNEARISEGRLRAGDELRCGQTRFVVTLLAQPSPPPSPSPSPRDREVPKPTPPSSQIPFRQSPAIATSGPEVYGALLRRVTDGREFELPPGKIKELGRGLGLPISLPDDLEVSTQHATLLFDGQRVQLQDTGSSNGTFVDGQRVTTCQLADGQRFRVGHTEFVIRVSPADSAGALTKPTAENAPRSAMHRERSQAEQISTSTNSRRTSDDSAALDIPGQNMLDPIIAGRNKPRQSIPVRRFDLTSSGKLAEDRDESDQPQPPAPQPPAPQPPAPQPSGGEPRPAFPEVGESGSADSGSRDSNQPEFPALSSSTADQPTAPQSPAAELTEPAARDLAARDQFGSDQSARDQFGSDLAGRDLAADALIGEPPTGHVALERPSASGEEPLAAPSSTSSSAAIDWDDTTAYANQASELRPIACRSGLVVYRGLSSGLDPVDVGLRVLQSTNGWVLNGGDIENWMEAAQQGLSGLPREWLNPAGADDASWMLPFLSNWGSGKAWLVFASADLDEVLENLLSLRPIAEDAAPLMPALTPEALANFLAESDAQAISRYFRPFDAILVEIRAGHSWALFMRESLQVKLNLAY